MTTRKIGSTRLHARRGLSWGLRISKWRLVRRKERPGRYRHP